MNTKIHIAIVFILIEWMIGTLAGIHYVENYDGKNMGLNQSIIRFYGSLNLIFLSTVTFLGIIHGLIIKKADRIVPAIFTSIVSGLIALAIYSATFSYLSYELNIRKIPLFLTLLGMVIGFNVGLNRKK